MIPEVIERAVLVWACVAAVGCASPVGPSSQPSPPVGGGPALSERFLLRPITPLGLYPCGLQTIDARPPASAHAVLSETLQSLVDMSANLNLPRLEFDIEAMDGGSRVTGEIIRADGNAELAAMTMHMQMLLEPGSLDFDTPEALVSALIASVDFAAVIIIDGAPEARTCKPEGVISGRFVALYEQSVRR